MPSKPGYDTNAFADRLRQYDPLLRLVWGYAEGYWRVERKVKHGTDFDPKYAAQWDMYVMVRDGYMLALKFLPNQMDERVFYTLWLSDMHRFKDYGKMLDEDEREAFLAKRRNWSEKNEYQARDLWTSLNSSYRHNTIGHRDFNPRGTVV